MAGGSAWSGQETLGVAEAEEIKENQDQGVEVLAADGNPVAVLEVEAAAVEAAPGVHEGHPVSGVQGGHRAVTTGGQEAVAQSIKGQEVTAANGQTVAAVRFLVADLEAKKHDILNDKKLFVNQYNEKLLMLSLF